MTWHPEVLAQRQQRVLKQIGPAISRHGFYLAGGTAVALHLGHRRSIDFDWFKHEGFDDPEAFAGQLKKEGIAFVIDQLSTGTLHGFVSGVSVSFLRHQHPLIARVRSWGRVRIAGRADLAAMKLNAITRRGAKKDFVDIYALGLRGCSLRRMIGFYQAKYAIENTAHLLCSLAYFQDADPDPLPKLFLNVRWRTIKETILSWVRRMTPLQDSLG